MPVCSQKPSARAAARPRRSTTPAAMVPLAAPVPDATGTSRSASRPSIFAIFWRKAKTVSRAAALVAMALGLSVNLFLLCSY